MQKQLNEVAAKVDKKMQVQAVVNNGFARMVDLLPDLEGKIKQLTVATSNEPKGSSTANRVINLGNQMNSFSNDIDTLTLNMAELQQVGDKAQASI